MPRLILWFVLVFLASACQQDGGKGEGSLNLEVRFPEGGGIKVGDNVMVKGLVSGQVTGVDLSREGVLVRIQLDGKASGIVTQGSTFAIDTDKLIAGKMCVRVEPPAQDSPAYAQNTVVEGEAPRSLSQQVGQVGRELLDHGGEVLSDKVDQAGNQVQAAAHNLVDPGSVAPGRLAPALQLDGKVMLVLEVDSASIPEKTLSGKTWDSGFDTDPDVIMNAFVGSTVVLSETEAQETLSPSWMARSRPFPYSPGGTVRVQVFDNDVQFNDLIGEGEIPFPSSEELNVTRKVDFGQVYDFTYRFVPAQPAP